MFDLYIQECYQIHWQHYKGLFIYESNNFFIKRQTVSDYLREIITEHFRKQVKRQLGRNNEDPISGLNNLAEEIVRHALNNLFRQIYVRKMCKEMWNVLNLFWQPCRENKQDNCPFQAELFGFLNNLNEPVCSFTDGFKTLNCNLHCLGAIIMKQITFQTENPLF